MRIPLSRSSILVALVIAILLAALPGAIRRIVQSGNPYLFTRQFFEDLFTRLSGYGRFRFVVQPSVAIFLGARDGLRDARTGSPPFFLALLFQRKRRATLVRSALVSVVDLVSIAIILDVIAQYLLFRRIHPGAALILGPVLIAVPYSLSRTVANGIVRRRSQQTTPSGQS
jgi:hypothetical protein